MTFDRAWVLAIAWLPLAWMVFEWRRTTRRWALVLKALSLAAILLALAEPRLNVHRDQGRGGGAGGHVGQRFAADLEHASQLAARDPGERGRHWMRVIPFARSTRSLDTSEDQKPWQLQPTAGEAGRATDLEAAIREAVASLPAGMVPRIALISDGKENKGSVARAAWQAQQLGIPIDTFALKGRRQPALRLESVSLPSHRVHGRAVSHRPGGVGAEGWTGGSGTVGRRTHAGQDAGDSWSAGENPMRLHASLNTPGALDLVDRDSRAGRGRGAFRSGGDAAAAEGPVCHRGFAGGEFASAGDARRRRSSMCSAAAISRRRIWPTINW